MANATPAPQPAPGAGAPAPMPGAMPGAPMGDRPRIAPPIRRSDSSRCRTPGCMKYHDFFQWNGKYYCLECYEALRNATRVTTGAAAAAK
jgi:hypothetical protein